MEMLDRDSKLFRIAANFVQCRETVKDIERRVFQPFRHYWAGTLLKFVDEFQLERSKIRITPLKRLEQQNAAKEIENGGVDGCVSSFGGSDRSKNNQSIGFRHAGFGIDVGAVDRQSGDY